MPSGIFSTTALRAIGDQVERIGFEPTSPAQHQAAHQIKAKGAARSNPDKYIILPSQGSAVPSKTGRRVTPPEQWVNEYTAAVAIIVTRQTEALTPRKCQGPEESTPFQPQGHGLTLESDSLTSTKPNHVIHSAQVSRSIRAG